VRVVNMEKHIVFHLTSLLHGANHLYNLSMMI
jgi:hypothetical protein